MLPSRVLRAAGFSAAAIDVITAEVMTMPLSVLDRDELWAEAIAAVWIARSRRPDIGPAYLRIRVRGALRDAIRRELRAEGRLDRTFYWPWYRPASNRTWRTMAAPVVRRCADCSREIMRLGTRRCADCARERRRRKQRQHNAAYYRRRQAA